MQFEEEKILDHKKNPGLLCHRQRFAQEMGKARVVGNLSGPTERDRGGERANNLKFHDRKGEVKNFKRSEKKAKGQNSRRWQRIKKKEETPAGKTRFRHRGKRMGGNTAWKTEHARKKTQAALKRRGTGLDKDVKE